MKTSMAGAVLALGLAIAGAIALAGGVTPAPAQAARHAPGGKIVFQTNRDGNAEIYTMNTDGTERVNLTRHPAADMTPHWSADGRRIAFVSFRGGSFAIYTMDADGTGVAIVPGTGASDRWPTWVGNDRLLFQRGAFLSRDVYVVKADGTGLTNLTPDSADSAWATAAPHEPSIALSRFTPAEGQRLYTLNTRDGVMKLVTAASPDVGDVQADWSPKGNDLVFARFGATDTDLFLVHKDGTGLRQLTDTPARQESQPSFSADGTKIVFHACVDPGGAGQHCANYAINVGGSGEVELTSIPTAPYVDTFTGDRVDPFWSVDGTGTGPSLAQTNGRLEVTLPAGTALGSGGYANAFAFMTCRFTGDYDMEVDYELLSGPLPDFVNVGFDAAELTSGGSYVGQHGVFVHNPSGIPTVSTHYPNPADNAHEPDSSPTGSLRLVRSTTVGGTTVTVMRRPAGGGWQTMATRPADPVDMSAANLNVFTNLTPFLAEVRAAYDNFRINSGTIDCPTWWDDSSPAWQPTK